MNIEPQNFFAAALGAGAILSGFCGTFLSFRIQRESAYYRQPVLDYTSGEAKDVYIGLSHFTSSFLLLILASVVSIIFGVVLPLIAMAGANLIWQSPKIIVAGLIASTVLITGYFVCELVHYGILNRNLLHDPGEWGRSRKTVGVTILSSLLAVVLVLRLL